mgnify:CR=1 FL=1
MTPINIYAELTPNPNSMKFVANINLLEGGVVEYDSKEAAVNCPMAVSLFAFSGINKVFTYKFITQNTVEEKILIMQKGKLKLAEDLISTEESFVKNLSRADIISIFD